jgi:hypothetical protein
MNAFRFNLDEVIRHYDIYPNTSQKSFYGKAHVWELKDGTRVLQSYQTYVARFTPSGDIIRMWGGWSATTGKHIAAFCGMNKKAFTALPLEN